MLVYQTPEQALLVKKSLEDLERSAIKGWRDCDRPCPGIYILQSLRFSPEIISKERRWNLLFLSNPSVRHLGAHSNRVEPIVKI